MEETAWEPLEYTKDGLVIAIDARSRMFSTNNDDTTCFHSCIELAVRILKDHIVAADGTLIAVVLFGTSNDKNDNDLRHVYELQGLGVPSAERIQMLQQIACEEMNIRDLIGNPQKSLENCLSSVLWHCGISFTNAKLKREDSQRIWIFTNDFNGPSEKDEHERIVQRIADHEEQQRSIYLYYMKTRQEEPVDLAMSYYEKAFQKLAEKPHESLMQVIESNEGLFESTRRKHFRKRKMAYLPLKMGTEMPIGTNLYVLVLPQRPSAPVFLDAKTNKPTKTETNWLCSDTGAYLEQAEIKKYFLFGKDCRVYFSNDDIAEIKGIESPGIQLIHFQKTNSIPWHLVLRSPYFIYPSEEKMEGSKVAFACLHAAMVKRNVVGIVRLVIRSTSGPRIAAMIPQSEEYDECGQLRPDGFHLVPLPFAEEIRTVSAQPQNKASLIQIEAARKLVSQLQISELPILSNPALQKHYACVQALALDEDDIEFDDSNDGTVPDKEGFERPEIKTEIDNFYDVCNGDTMQKRKSNMEHKRANAKRSLSDAELAEWKELAAQGQLKKRNVSQLKEFLYAVNKEPVGRKSNLIELVQKHLSTDP